MSTLSDIFQGIKRLFVVECCRVCGESLMEGEHKVCTLCRMTAPLTGYWAEADNPVLDKCRDMLPIHRASGFLFFVHGSGWRRLIHSFKYRGAWSLAEMMGRWYGQRLKESGLYDDVDMVIPLPLHPWKKCLRGYNQSEYIARGIARELGVEMNINSVVRQRNTSSQARQSRRNRAQNVAGAFRVKNSQNLSGKHLLLVDDVMTTGSTLLSCAEAILEASPTARVSIAALAVSRHELGIKD